MTLYLITTEGLGDYYAIANTFDEAANMLTSKLKEAEYGFSKKRVVKGISIVTNKVTSDGRSKPHFTDNNRLIIKE